MCVTKQEKYYCLSNLKLRQMANRAKELKWGRDDVRESIITFNDFTWTVKRAERTNEEEKWDRFCSKDVATKLNWFHCCAVSLDGLIFSVSTYLSFIISLLIHLRGWGGYLARVSYMHVMENYLQALKREYNFFYLLLFFWWDSRGSTKKFKKNHKALNRLRQ